MTMVIIISNRMVKNMKKTLILLGLCGAVLQVYAEQKWVEGFTFQHALTTVDQGKYVQRESFMSQLNKQQGQDADFLSDDDLLNLGSSTWNELDYSIEDAAQQNDIHEQAHDEVERVPAQVSSNLLVQCQQFFMKIIAFLYER